MSRDVNNVTRLNSFKFCLRSHFVEEGRVGEFVYIQLIGHVSVTS